jgi:cysteine desulfurase
MKPRIYLDWNATAPLRPEAQKAMTEAMEVFGNPSSIHAEGRSARMLIEDARTAIAALVGARPRDVVFTSGGTEANVLALSPGRQGAAPASERLLVSAIEHPSVLSAGATGGRAPEQIPVTADGVVDVNALRQHLSQGPPAFVSVMFANNETGVIQPISEVAQAVHEAGGILHVDAVQALGKINFKINEIGTDLLTVSAHKIGGPKGIGALIAKNEGARLSPQLVGGGQERGRRGGTENVIGIAGFGAAARAVADGIDTEVPRMAALRAALERALKQFPGAEIIAESASRLPNTVMVALRGLKAETTVIAFDLAGIAISAGSACTSGKVHASHVLTAMQVPQELAQSALRFSLGSRTTEDEIAEAAEVWRRVARTGSHGV